MIRRRQSKRYEDDDDNPLDEHGVLKDGRTLRTPMYLMDDLQRVIAQDSRMSGRDTILHDAIKPNNHQMVTDVFGSTVGLSRPGYRLLHTGPHTTDHAIHATHEMEEAYRLYGEEESGRWQGSDREIPVKVITGDARTDAYLAREEHDANAWRGPANK
jgi:hypothetical protein